MITQTITATMTQTNLAKILTRRYDVGREIKFILYADELLSEPIDLTDYTVVITVIKPDNNFVIQNFIGDTVTITEQMEVVTGTGYYCIHVTKDTETIYTGQGEFIIDDVLISDEELESISEVNGLKFPDDFLTVEDHVAVIDDTVTSTEKTWSSSKISDEIENASVIVSKTAEGNPIEISDGASAPLVECVTQITGYQEGSGTPSPDNIRPITAYTEGEIEVRGKNLIDISLLGSYDISGTGIMRIGVPVMLKPDTYTISRKSGSDTLYICNVTNNYSSTTITEYPFTFTLNQTSEIIIRAATTDISRWESVDLQLEVGTTATSYEPYTSTTHTTTFPSAIYRGSEDVVNGKVVSEWVKVTLSSSDNIVRNGDHSFYIIPSVSAKANGEIISDKFQSADTANVDCIFINLNGAIRFNTLDSYATADAFKAHFTPIEIAYELATTTTTPVTPTNLPVKSLHGYNHIESTTGDMEIEYITEDYQPLVDSIVTESKSNITKLWDAGFTPSPGVWLEYDFGEDLENYDAIVILFVVSGWEGNNADSVTVYPKIQNLNTTKYYHYIKGTDYGIQFWRVSGTTYGLGSIDGNYPPQYKAVYGIKY